MAGRANVKVNISGPLFETSAPDKLEKAIGGFIQELGNEAGGILMGFIDAGGFVKSGNFRNSVESIYTRTRGVGYAKVYPTEAWGGTITLGHSGAKTKGGKARMTVQSVKTESGGPTRTWFETGERGGVKLRPGIYGFRKTKQRMNAMDLRQRALDVALPVLQ